MNIAKIIRNRKLILEGLANKLIKKQFVEQVAEYRMNICKSCKYDFYDGKCEVNGLGKCCGACGCVLELKVRSMESECGAAERGLEPLWHKQLTEEQADKLEEDICD